MKSFKTALFIMITVIILIAVAYLLYVSFNTNQNNSAVDGEQNSVKTIEANANDLNEDSNAQDNSIKADKSQDTEENTAGNYVNYEDVDISKLSGNIVLDFTASWCPTCQAFKNDLISNSNEIPNNTTIIFVNYDEYTDLKQKYGVTTQHTFVKIDNQGNKIKSWIGGTTLQSVTEKL